MKYARFMINGHRIEFMGTDEEVTKILVDGKVIAKK